LIPGQEGLVGHHHEIFRIQFVSRCELAALGVFPIAPGCDTQISLPLRPASWLVPCRIRPKTTLTAVSPNCRARDSGLSCPRTGEPARRGCLTPCLLSLVGLSSSVHWVAWFSTTPVRAYSGRLEHRTAVSNQPRSPRTSCRACAPKAPLMTAVAPSRAPHTSIHFMKVVSSSLSPHNV